MCSNARAADRLSKKAAQLTDEEKALAESCGKDAWGVNGKYSWPRKKYLENVFTRAYNRVQSTFAEPTRKRGCPASMNAVSREKKNDIIRRHSHDDSETYC